MIFSKNPNFTWKYQNKSSFCTSKNLKKVVTALDKNGYKVWFLTHFGYRKLISYLCYKYWRSYCSPEHWHCVLFPHRSLTNNLIQFFLSRTAYQYDYMGRLVAFTKTINGGRRPSDKTVTQFFYADVRHPFRVTHVQSPKSGLTQRLLYDEQGQLGKLIF